MAAREQPRQPDGEEARLERGGRAGRPPAASLPPAGTDDVVSNYASVVFAEFLRGNPELRHFAVPVTKDDGDLYAGDHEVDEAGRVMDVSGDEGVGSAG